MSEKKTEIKKSFSEMVHEANRRCNTCIPCEKLAPIKRSFTKGSSITIDEICEAFRKYPKISEEEILRFFKKEAWANAKDEISGQKISRPYLIDIVYAFEAYTGRKMSNDTNPVGPLADYDDQGITLSDIAKFFATGDGKIAEIKKQKAEN